jgi:hypothetical protein
MPGLERPIEQSDVLLPTTIRERSAASSRRYPEAD